MTRERFQQIKAILNGALDVPSHERAAYVISASGGDAELRAEVESLLQAQEESADFLSEAAGAYVPDALEDELADQNIGRRIGAYEVVREIGRGGMGAVYLAERVDEFRQKAAIKLLHPGMNSRMVVGRFRHERQILAGLDHPNIARLLDGGATDEGRPYFVMEYIEGAPIDVYVRERSLAVAEILELFRQVCAAVEYAHRNLIVHRDLKPGNILVAADGVPKLMDFGIAKLLRGDDLRETLARTQVGMRLMTPGYASPEQARGLPVTTATDVYSLGTVLFELLTGTMPYKFATDSVGEVERVICEVEPRAPSAVVEGAAGRKLQGDLDTIVLKALQKEPLRRYSSVEQLSADIRRHLDGIPIQARPQTVAYRASRFVKRNRVAVVAGALVAVSLAGGLAVAAMEARIAGQERRRAERRFNDVRQLAHAFLFDFHDAIQNLPGATPARQLVVDKALEYLNKLSQEAGNDPALSRELAEAYLRVGDVQGNPGVFNLGDAGGALKSYARALGLSQELVRRDPKDREAVVLLARSHHFTGDLIAARNDPGGAVPHFKEASRILEGARDVAARTELASVSGALGDSLGHPGLPSLGDAEGAKQAYEKGLGIWDALTAEHPDNVRSRRGSGLYHLKLGDLALSLGELDGALSQYRLAASRFAELSAANPDSAPAQLTLGLITAKLGGAYEAAGQNQAALVEYRKAGDLLQKLVQADPQNVQATSNYALNLQNWGGLLQKTNGSAAAMPLYREALGILGGLLRADPESPLRKRRYAQLVLAMGTSAAAGGRKQEAAARYGEGMKIFRELADQEGAGVDDLSIYAQQLMESPLPEFADATLALRYAKRAVEMTHGAKGELVDRLARAYEATGDRANAVVFEEKAVALAPAGSARRKEWDLRLAEWKKTP